MADIEIVPLQAKDRDKLRLMLARDYSTGIGDDAYEVYAVVVRNMELIALSSENRSVSCNAQLLLRKKET